MSDQPTPVPICPYCGNEVTDDPSMDVPTRCAVVIACEVCDNDVKVIPVVRYLTEEYTNAD